MLTALVRPSWGDDENAAATAGEVANKQQMHRLFPDPTANTQQAPLVIPQMQIDDDPSGKIAYISAERSDTDGNKRFLPESGQ